MILAIDPGTEQSAVVQWWGGKIDGAAIMPNLAVLAWLRTDHDQSHSLWIERISSYGMPVGREVLETCEWVGRFAEAFQHGRGVHLVYRRDIKLHHCGTCQAKDANVRQALIDKNGKPGTKKAPGITYGLHDDLWSAFAIATYATETNFACSPSGDAAPVSDPSARKQSASGQPVGQPAGETNSPSK